jgi:hypothetical protein
LQPENSQKQAAEGKTRFDGGCGDADDLADNLPGS